MSVSRVEYDAALARVRARANVRGLRLHDVTVADFTLAALGLDEPPTEAKNSMRDLVNLDCTRCEGDGVLGPAGDHCPDCDGSGQRLHDPRCSGECVKCHGAEACSLVGYSCTPCNGECATWVPPAEPPKACPTCGGEGCDSFLTGAACPRCKGTGIDTEPPKACPLATPCKDVRICSCGVDNRGGSGIDGGTAHAD